MKARVFRNKRSQLLRIPKEFQFAGSEVFLRREGTDIVLSGRPLDWSGFMGAGLAASNWFLTGLADGAGLD